MLEVFVIQRIDLSLARRAPSRSLIILGLFAWSAIVCVSPKALFGQETIPEQEEDGPPGVSSGSGRSITPPSEVLLRLRPAPGTVVEGTHGKIDFSSPSPYDTTGVLLQAEPSWP